MVEENALSPREIEEIVAAHVPLADRLARRYSNGIGVDDDLRQVAHIGLFHAARRFDPTVGMFARFAAVTVVGELKKHLRDMGWGVRVPRSLQEDAITVAAARDRLTTRLGRQPTVGEVAEHTGFDSERVVEAIRVQESRFAASVDQLIVDLADSSATEESALVNVGLTQLDVDEQRLLHLRFVEGLSQSEIGRLIGISQPQVHRRLASALESARAELVDADGYVSDDTPTGTVRS